MIRASEPPINVRLFRESAILLMRPVIALLLIMIRKSCLPLDLGPPETWAIACSVLHPGATASIVAPSYRHVRGRVFRLYDHLDGYDN
jgi:hypothetical protein